MKKCDSSEKAINMRLYFPGKNTTISNVICIDTAAYMCIMPILINWCDMSQSHSLAFSLCANDMRNARMSLCAANVIIDRLTGTMRIFQTTERARESSGFVIAREICRRNKSTKCKHVSFCEPQLTLLVVAFFSTSQY